MYPDDDLLHRYPCLFPRQYCEEGDRITGPAVTFILYLHHECTHRILHNGYSTPRPTSLPLTQVILSVLDRFDELLRKCRRIFQLSNK